jgi:Phage integrase family
MPPRIDNAPGLTWKPRRNGWEARWQAKTSAVRDGYTIKSRSIWAGVEPTEIEAAYIQDQCNSLQGEMEVWSRGGIPTEQVFDGSVAGLIRCYQGDEDSPYRDLRYKSREYYRSLCKRIENDLGDRQLTDLNIRHIKHWHKGIGRVAMAHALAKMLRILVNFGAGLLEDNECERLSGVLGRERFKMPQPRNSVLSADQASAIRKQAHFFGLPSVALSQAFQFDLMLRQKDVIGEWVPISESGISDVLDGQNKWLRGIRWEEIDANFILKHVTSKRQKEITVNLRDAPMLMEEMGTNRSAMPNAGPVVVSERSGRPWYPVEFRRNWREVATAAGVPRSVRNMDSRAGAITEATEAGIDLEHIKQAATHSDISMTQRYARGAEEKTAGVMQKRAEHRKNKPLTDR